LEDSGGAPNALAARLDNGGAVAAVGDIGGEQLGFPATCPDPGHDPLAARPVDVDDGDLGALGGEQFGDLLADIAAGAGHHRYLIFELHCRPIGCAPLSSPLPMACRKQAGLAGLPRTW